MSSLFRKPVITSVLLNVAAMVFSCAAWAQAPLSVSVATFSKDPAKVAALQKGISMMKAASSADPMSAQFRTSFAYWSNTHGYFGNGKHATNLANWVAQRRPSCLQIMTTAQCDAYYAPMHNTPVPNDGFTDDIWGTCQHGNLNFLPWHRLYLHFFNRTLRKNIGDLNFTLPYWNYFDNYVPAQKGLALPSLVTNNPGSNALYDQWRTLNLNQNKVWMDASSASAVQAFKFNDFTRFSNTLQNQPHGAMHCAVGSGCAAPDMGFVPIAGLDSIFYMHHTNIDRLWQCWLVRKANGQKIDLAWAKANLGMPDSWYDTAYTFADENGNKVTMTIADVFIPGKVDVSYDNLTNCAATPMSKTTLLAAGPESLSRTPLKAHAPLSSAKSITLGTTPVTVKLQADKLLANAAPAQAESAQVQQTYLTLENVALKGNPALTYKILLVNSKAPTKTSYVATINFFGAGGHHDANSASLGTLQYQVSSNLQEIGVTSASDASVKFEPTNLLTGKMSVKQAPDNGVTVSNIRLHTGAE